MDINYVLSEAQAIASEFGLGSRIIDLTDNIISLRLDFGANLFVQIYANQLKDKLNLNLVLNDKRLLGADAEGSRYHIHPGDDPSTHIFTEEKESMRSFMLKALKVLDERSLL